MTVAVANPDVVLKRIGQQFKLLVSARGMSRTRKNVISFSCPHGQNLIKILQVEKREAVA
jgi:hypothetical protein